MEAVGIQLVVMTVFGVIVSFVANGRGRSPVGWFFIGFVAPCIGLILVLVLPDMNVEQERHKRLRRDNQRLRERVTKDRQVADQRHDRSGRRLAAHDAVLGLDTASEEGDRPPQLPPRSQAQPAQQAGWHFALGEDSESQGPVSVETLRQMNGAGEITDDCLYWTKGMTAWLRLEEIPELEKLLDEA